MSTLFGSRRQKGQATLEYAIAGSVLVMALFVVEFDGKTAAQFLAEAVRVFYKNLSYFLSLP
ncbi:hypothetical protein QRD43_05365 [Pelomonas sp. APW6]|uniref:Flp family type IVb pilin n=1 Tax=Roseateles subflavus TaxID=3053353 RepID=A0ABT7LGC0_9BURK|nr:hypothetical protein [Pelomonas sp. APW6]MDL5031332.1 hypothetical protein [Pelomonas sp. APW6]